MWGDYFFNATEGAACSGAQLKAIQARFMKRDEHRNHMEIME